MFRKRDRDRRIYWAVTGNILKCYRRWIPIRIREQDPRSGSGSRIPGSAIRIREQDPGAGSGSWSGIRDKAPGSGTGIRIREWDERSGSGMRDPGVGSGWESGAEIQERDPGAGSWSGIEIWERGIWEWELYI
ncbi:hypothetical protein NE237_000023 [Protea cynaroides]|uniref:Uncharacterized protein n=1 Tax=Protea cynaroides TaxID=273540 RepID=A0A9Q0GLM5_9MAGN|nr:hypothetical protein NE237_000023 [Protea cynaroides]